MLDGAAVWGEAFAGGIRPRPRLTVSEWSDRYRMLSGKGASEPGRWRTDRTPYLREPMDALSVDSDAEEVVLWFGTQLGKSEACNNFLGYTIDHNPGPIMLIQPTLDLAKRYSKQRVAPMIADTPELSARVLPARARDSGNTLLEKEFAGGIAILTGANSAAGLRSMPARDLICDEIDAYPHAIDDEGDPISVAEKRQDTFARRKRLKTSTCTIKGESRIEQAYNASDRRRYFVPCPHCGEMQTLQWACLHWVNDDPTTARYRCAACATLIPETAKSDMLARGEWRAEEPAARTRGYHLSSLYSPPGWLSWSAIVREYLAAKTAHDAGDPTLMQVFENTRLAETWEAKGATVAEADVQARAEAYPLRTVPRGALYLTAAVDVQGDRLELQIQGWGREQECWILDHARIYGDPAESAVWSALDELLRTPLRNAYGIDLRINATAIDHGGHHAAQVEAYARARAGWHVIAVKGSSQPGRPVMGRPKDYDTNWRGKRVPRGVRIWPVGTDTAKHLLYSRLRLTTAGPGYIHTSNELPDEWFAQLTAEQLLTRYVKGRPRSDWVLKKGRRNEALDLWVYNYAAAAYRGMLRWKVADWDRLAHDVEPPLFAPADAPSTETPPADAPPADAPPADAPPADPGARPRPGRAPAPNFATSWRR